MQKQIPVHEGKNESGKGIHHCMSKGEKDRS